MKVCFVGAGPGDPELITKKGARLVAEADIIIYAGSLVNPEMVAGVSAETRLYDSAGMTLDEVTAIYRQEAVRAGIIVRLHTGDPCVYGAIQEQIDFCRAEGIEFEVVPGVSSFSAATAVLGRELTLPGISQTVILSRIAGRTPVPEREALIALAKHRSSMVLFLSVGHMERVVADLLTAYDEATPVAVVYRASWPDQKIVQAPLNVIAERVKEAGITRQALILVGDVLNVKSGPDGYSLSKLYSSDFSHGYRTSAP
jgi:precorrin-4/cobalt-precorrin-4 C11-methyltransferase